MEKKKTFLIWRKGNMVWVSSPCNFVVQQSEKNWLWKLSYTLGYHRSYFCKHCSLRRWEWELGLLTCIWGMHILPHIAFFLVVHAIVGVMRLSVSLFKPICHIISLGQLKPWYLLRKQVKRLKLSLLFFLNSYCQLTI